nr:reverse transcriptase domain-containing protein [Tanacetum cinerariifolium]
METRGRKNFVAEPAPPARDPRNVETIERLQQGIQELELQQLRPDSPAEEQKLSLTSGTMSQWTSILLAEKTLSTSRRIKGKSKVETWEKMKKLMKAKFLPENHRQEAFLDYHNLSQHNMTIEEVINEFDKLRMRCDVVEEEEHVVTRFLGVLKPEIVDIAKNRGSISRFTSRFTSPTRTASPIVPKTAPKATTPTTSAEGTTRERFDITPHCYKCGGLRHYARDCPNLKTLAFVPDDAGTIYDTDAEPKIDEPGNELVYPNRGEALVIQRALNMAVSKSVDDNSWLCNNIFRTKCTSKGKFVI